MTTLYLNACHSLITNPQHHPDSELRRTLKHDHGIDARRLSRFSQLALLGALPLHDRLPADAAIYLASPFSSPGKFGPAFPQLMDENLPSLLDFIANIHNAATFHLAQALGSSGNSIFISGDADNYLQTLTLAAAQLENGSIPHALIGWIYEYQQPDETDGSIWWLLGREPVAHPLGRLTLHPTAPVSQDLPPIDINRSARDFFPAVCALQQQLIEQRRLHHPAQGLCPAFDIVLD